MNNYLLIIEGMTDGLVIDNPKDNINVNDIYLKSQSNSLNSLLKKFDEDLNMKMQSKS